MIKLKNLLTIFFISIVSMGYSQPTYPIQTQLKGDSVVILTKKQSDNINLLIENQKIRIQKYKTEIKLVNDTNTLLINDIKIKDSIINHLDSLLIVQNNHYDSLISKIDTLENWILSLSIDNGYLYYSWQDSTVKVIDLSLYMLVSHKKTGNYSLITRGEATNIDYWKQMNLIKEESPEISWELNISPKYKPRIVLFPYKLTPKL
jgi:hypothetical protein